MLTIKEFIGFLRTKNPTATYFNSTLDKSSNKCIGVYGKEAAKIPSVGGAGSSYNVLATSIVIHWTEDAHECETLANEMYQKLDSVIRETTPNGTVIVHIDLPDTKPVWVGRDDRNIAEYVIRANIIYERG